MGLILPPGVRLRPDLSAQNVIQATATGIVPLTLQLFTGSTANLLEAQDAAGSNAARFRILSTGVPSCPGLGVNSERFGSGSVASGDSCSSFGLGATSTSFSSAFGRGANANVQSLAMGRLALASSNDLALGDGAQALAGQSVAIGSGTKTIVSTGGYCSAIGYLTTANGLGGIALGTNMTAGANELLIGSGYGAVFGISEVYIGQGKTNATSTAAVRIQATGAAGANVAGPDLKIAGGKSTGAAAGGGVFIQTSPGVSGAGVLNPLVTLMQFTGANQIGVFGVPPVVQQVGGAIAAGAAYTAVEQGMINTMWNALRAYGWLT